MNIQFKQESVTVEDAAISVLTVMAVLAIPVLTLLAAF